MSAGPETSTDLVAVACVVEASLLLASEWTRVLIEYVYPLLKRLYELHPSHQFRLAFVTYGAADTRPFPLLSKKYFAPLSQVTKELREEPSKLGIGQTNSGSGRGLCALEGLVAAIELFDILMASANFNVNHSQTQSPQKDNRSLVSHLLHIAASPPDNAQRPQCNTLQHLDFVNWDSIPGELRKRKINLSLISLRKIPQFQDLQSSVAGPGAQSPWFNVHTPHVLLLAGFPTPQKMGTKRQTDAVPSDQSPDAKRQKVVADPIPKTSPVSPVPQAARIPQNQRPQPVASSQVTQLSTTISTPNPTPAQPVQATPPPPVPRSTPATASPSAAPPPSGSSFKDEVYEQVVAQAGMKFGQMMEHLKALERDIVTLDSRILDAQNTGQAAILAGLQKDRTLKAHVRDRIKTLLKQHYHKILLAKDSLNASAGTVGSALPNGSAEAGPSTQSHPQNVPTASSQPPMGPTVDEHKSVISDSQALAQPWPSRGGTVSAPDGGTPQAGPSQTQSHPAVAPEIATQMQKGFEKKGIRPPSFGPSSQTPGTTSHEMGVNPSTTNSQVIQWLGTLSGTFPKLAGQVTNEVQVHVVAHPMSVDGRTENRPETWPKNLTLIPCKEPVKDPAELSSWLNRHQFRTRVMRFAPNPRAPDAAMNEQRFHALIKFMDDHCIYAYAGWQLPSGNFSYNIFIFAMPRGDFLAATVFPDGIPDLPGSGNVLDAPVEQRKPQLLSGLPIPPEFLARMQGLEPAKQKQIAQFFRAQQLEQLRRQQLLQTQQSHTTPGQTLSSLGMTIPQHPYTAVANIPTALHTNVNPPTNAGAYNAGGGTVNYEMMRSFMQRNAEGSPSQGMNTGGMNSGQMP